MAKETSDSDRVMAQKVAKVREVIANVSKNDIVLALHSYDLDVDRTIQALMEGGGALDEWVRPAGASGKNKKNKNKKPAAETKPPAPSSSSASSVIAPAVNGAKAAPVVAPSAPVTSLQAAKPAAAAPEKKNGTANANKVAAPHFTGETSGQGKEAITNAFKSLRELLAERERALLSEYRGGASFAHDLSALAHHINAFGRVSSASGATAAAVSPALSSSFPISPPPSSSIKHSGSRSSLVSSVGDDSGLGNGSPIPPEAVKAPPKVVRPAPGGPINVASSDGLNAEELAAIQRTVAESMAKAGISADVLSGLSGGASSNLVRRPNKEHRNKQGNATNNNNGGGPRQQNGGKQGNKKNTPALSLFN